MNINNVYIIDIDYINVINVPEKMIFKAKTGELRSQF